MINITKEEEIATIANRITAPGGGLSLAKLAELLHDIIAQLPVCASGRGGYVATELPEDKGDAA